MVIGEMRHVRAFLPKTCQLTTYRWKKPDGERFAQVRSRPLLTCEGKCSCWRAKPAHFVGHLPIASQGKQMNYACPFPQRIGLVEKCPRILQRPKKDRNKSAKISSQIRAFFSCFFLCFFQGRENWNEFIFKLLRIS